MSELIRPHFRDLLYRAANRGRNVASSRKGSRIKGRFLWALAHMRQELYVQGLERNL